MQIVKACTMPAPLSRQDQNLWATEDGGRLRTMLKTGVKTAHLHASLFMPSWPAGSAAPAGRLPQETSSSLVVRDSDMRLIPQVLKC